MSSTGGVTLALARNALAPVDEPDAELWVVTVTDCKGPFPMPDGYLDEFTGPCFPARTKGSDPLPPGEYLAVLKIERRTGRLT